MRYSLPLFNPDVKSESWNLSPKLFLPHPNHSAWYLSVFLYPFYLDISFPKESTISETFFNIHLGSTTISHVYKHFWNTSSSYYRHPLSTPTVQSQIWETIPRYVTKMSRSCLSGLDVEMLFSCSGIHPK